MSNLLSFSSVKLDLFSKENDRLKSASGFILEASGRYYLVTNRHVLAGVDIDANRRPEPAIRPYFLKTSVHFHEGMGEKGASPSMGLRKRITMQLYDDKDGPRWIERQTKEGLQPIADMVALPIHTNLTLTLFTANSPRLKEINIKKSSWNEYSDYWTKISAIPMSAIDTDVDYGPPDPVHVIGYPLGWEPDGMDRTPSAFWRTSFIASEIYEPGARREDTFFVDPCASEGMAGAPVVGMKKDRLKLLGVYSDHSTAEFGANAGLVCGAWLLKQLIHAS